LDKLNFLLLAMLTLIKQWEWNFIFSSLNFALNYFLLFSTQDKKIKNKIVPIIPITKSTKPVIKLIIYFYFGNKIFIKSL
jgi:hypothetical protein